jgi:signal peptidase I
MRNLFRDFLLILVIALVIIFGIQFAFQKFVVVGPSMNTSLRDGQQILVNKLVYKFHDPERGDIIVFDPPFSAPEDYIKRIIGLPGESVEIKEGVVYIHKADGTVFPLDEPYVTDPAKQSFKGEIILLDEYFVMGDNRNNSNDSRSGWTVPRENIVGKAWIFIWPPSEWGLVPNNSFTE